MTAEGVKTAEEKAAEARRGPAPRRPARRTCRWACRARSRCSSARRRVGCWAGCGPTASRSRVVVLLTVVSVLLSSVGPKVLGRATDLIFAGFLGSQMPAGLTRDQVIAGLRLQGQTQMADLLSGVDFVPGQGIDFAALGRVLLVGAAHLRRVVRWCCGSPGGFCRAPSSRPCTGCARPWRPNLAGCRCPTSTPSRAASCSAGSPTTWTTSRRRCSRPSPSCSTRCSPSSPYWR